MTDLVVSAVYKADTHELVGEADKGTASLDRNAAAATRARDATGRYAGTADQATTSLRGQKTAADQLNATLGASIGKGGAYNESLRQQAAQASGITAKVREMSSAHSQYNGTVAQSQGLLKAGLITEAQHNANIRAAAVELQYARTGAKDASIEFGKLEQLLAVTGRTAGLGRAQIVALRAGIGAIPGVVANYPVASTFIAVAAAIGLAVAAEQNYEAVVNRVTIAVAARGNALGLTQQQYLQSARDIKDANPVSFTGASAIEGSFISRGLDPSLWNASAAAAVGWARIIGKDVPAAADDLAQKLVGPTKALDELAGINIYFSETATRAIREAEAQGDTARASALLLAQLKPRSEEAAEATTALGRAWNFAKNEGSNFVTGLGDTINQLLVLAGVADGVKKKTAGGTGDRDKYLYDIGPVERALDPYGTQLRDNANTRERLSTGLAKGYIDQARYLKDLNALNIKDAEIRKQQRDALLALDPVEKQREERIRSLLQQAPQQIAAVVLQTQYAQQQARAAGYSTLAMRDLQHAYEIQQASLPILTALENMHGAAADRLRAKLAELTAELKRKQIAEDAATTAADITQRYAAIGNVYQKAIKDATELRDAQRAALEAAPLGTFGDVDDLNREIDEIFNKTLANAYADDLRRRRDWAAGSARALADLTNATGDWAKTSEDLTHDLTDEMLKFTSGQKVSLADLGQFVEQWALKLVQQRLLAAPLNYAVGGIVDFVGAVLGVGGSDNLVASSMVAGAGGLGVGNVPVGVHHLGLNSGSFAQPRAAVNDNAALYINAVHHHSGYNLQPGEHRAIVQDDETIRTAAQESAVQRSLAGSGGGWGAPVIHNVIENHSGTPLKSSQGPTTRNADGSWNIRTIVDQVQDEIVRQDGLGQSQLTRHMDQSRGLDRKVG